MNNLSVADLRKNYIRGGLEEAEAPLDPIPLFQLWLSQAISAEIIEPNAMTLATASPSGYPIARMVLLKDFDQGGFVFFTNYNSDKGQQLLTTPKAALVFWWSELERQVRIEGNISQTTSEESDNYFSTRPRGSQLGAWVSNQSSVIPNREILEEKLKIIETEYQDQEIPRPSHWGGFRLVPVMIEFWQGRPNRLHDRLRYRLIDDHQWVRERLSP